MGGKQLDRNIAVLNKYIAPDASAILAQWIYVYDFKLKIKKSRATKLGDYRPPAENENHTITINNDLNKHAFLITFVHEIAHLVNWEKNKNRVSPHGEEWKEEFKRLMQPFFQLNIFPDDVSIALRNYMQNPAASSCSDLDLQRVLKKYDSSGTGILLESIPLNSLFKSGKGKIYKKLEKQRTRFLCVEIETGKKYLFSPVAEIERM
jgi:hypothetical protein